jgi:hypothetical protein
LPEFDMSRLASKLLCALSFSLIGTNVIAAETAGQDSSAAPAMHSIAASSSELPAPKPAGPTVTLAQLQLQQYFYVDFPRQIQWLDNQTQLAEAELALIARRVNGYRPFRSFHQYAATYTVDQQWQIALVAAQQRVQCLQNAQADLWRQRQAIAALYFQ